MAQTKKNQPVKVDFSSWQQTLQQQFSNLDAKDPSLWPVLPRTLLCIFIAAVVAALLWFVWLKDFEEELQTEQAQEVTLRADYQKKLIKAVSLDELKKQREQVQQYVLQLEKQLPSKAEMAALLSDINQAGLGRSLQFDLFRPGQIVVRDYYAAIAARDYGRAYRLWSDGGRASNQSPQQFANGFADTTGSSVEIGTPGDEDAGAGQRYIEIPVTVTATHADGSRHRYAGSYILHRTVVDGASAEDRAWRISSAKLRETTP